MKVKQKRKLLRKLRNAVPVEELKINPCIESKGYYVHSDRFPNVLGGLAESKEKAIKNFYEGLWESFEFLQGNRERLGKGPMADLEKFMEILGGD